MIDALPVWFWIPAAIVLWSALIVLCVRSRAADPYNEASELDVLERTGTRKNGGV